MTLAAADRPRKLKVRLFSACLLVFFVAMGLKASCQYMEVGIFTGTSYYIGDLNPSMPYRQVQIAYGVLARYNLDARWSVKLSAYRGTVKGSGNNKDFVTGKGLNFESPITDISGTVEFNFFNYFTGSRSEIISPYLYTGIGFFFFDPKSGGTSLRSMGTEGQNIGYNGRKPYSTMGVNVPFGIGVKFSLARRFCLSAFWEMHKTFTDYIDDISTTYYLNGPQTNPADPSAIYSDPTRDHSAGMQRGNPRTKDWYSFSGLTLTYKFDIRGKKRCKDRPYHK